MLPPPSLFLNLSLKRLVITYDLLFMLLLICIFHQLCKLTGFKKYSFSSQNLERPIRLWKICFVRHRITVCSWQCAEEDLILWPLVMWASNSLDFTLAEQQVHLQLYLLWKQWEPVIMSTSRAPIKTPSVLKETVNFKTDRNKWLL